MTKKCIFCGNKIKKPKHNQKFCSQICCSEYWKPKMTKNTIRWEVFERDSFKCVYCGRSVFDDNIKLELEHIIPESKGGKWAKDNLVTSCRTCNYGKGSKLLSEDTIKKIKRAIELKIT